MPWKECHVMDERLRFVARLLEGEKMAPLCAEFGISRKTGYKIFDRYKDCGVQAFSDRSIERTGRRIGCRRRLKPRSYV
jgi:transposase